MKTKSVLSLLIVLLMLGCMMPSLVYATNSSLPPAQGTLHIHKYAITNLQDALPAGTGEEVTTIPDTFKPLEGITFRLYQVTIGTDGVYPVAPFTVDDDTAPTSITDDNGTTFAVTAATPASVVTDQDGTATATLDQGIYLLIEDASPDVIAPAQPFLVAVPMTKADGTGWLTDVHVYPKNESMTAKKTVSTPSFTIGEILTYKIVLSIPNNITTAKEYKVTDALDEALDYVANSVNVKVAGKESELDSAPDLDTKYYTVDTSVAGVVAVVFTADGLTYLGDPANNLRAISVTLQAKTNAKVLEKQINTIGNEATIDFTNKDGDKTTTKTNTSGADTGTIQIKKMSINKAPLNGAKFQIASSEANAKNGVYLKKAADGSILDSGDTGYDTASDWEVLSAGTDGSALFDGLKMYTVDGSGNKQYLSYWVVETLAPGGYNLLTAPVKVDFSSAADDTNNFTVAIDVINNAGFELPKTGGFGSVLFIICGTALIGVAIVLFVASGKNKKTKKTQ